MSLYSKDAREMMLDPRRNHIYNKDAIKLAVKDEAEYQRQLDKPIQRRKS